MGPRAARIERADFVTPPEFRDLALAPNPAGRIGGARIELVAVGGKTRLGACYQQIPLRLLPPFNFDTGGGALLYLINPTTGLMDGDGHRVEVTARPGVRAVVTGQSATRIHPAVHGFATQHWDATVADDACLVILPGPAIPFAGCRYYQRGRFELTPGARFVWGDVWLPGRYARGALSERFRFERIVQDVEVRRGGRLVYRDRFRWDGPWDEAEVAWHFGGELATGGLVAVGVAPGELSPADPAVRRAVFPLDADSICVRWSGPPAAVTTDLVRVALGIAGRWVGGPDAPPWLLSSGALAPNHWFSLPPA